MAFTNRDMQKAFGFSPTQIRRWAVLALGKDPAFPQAGGIKRQYDLDEAFLIFLLGILITEYKFGQKEANEHTLNIAAQLKLEGLLPLNYFETIKNYRQKYECGLFMTIYITIFPNRNYLLKIQLNYKEIKEGDLIKCKEEFIIKKFYGDNQYFIEQPFGPEYTLNLTALHSWFIKISSYG